MHYEYHKTLLLLALKGFNTCVALGPSVGNSLALHTFHVNSSYWHRPESRQWRTPKYLSWRLTVNELYRPSN